MPVIVTKVPAGPLDGVKFVIFGFTLYVCGLVRVVEPVVTVTEPVCAPAGTTAVRYVVPESVTDLEATPPNFTTEAPVKPCPKTPTFAPTLPDVCVGSRLANGASPVATLKNVPWHVLGQVVLVPPPDGVVPYTSPFVC